MISICASFCGIEWSQPRWFGFVSWACREPTMQRLLSHRPLSPSRIRRLPRVGFREVSKALPGLTAVLPFDALFPPFGGLSHVTMGPTLDVHISAINCSVILPMIHNTGQKQILIPFNVAHDVHVLGNHVGGKLGRLTISKFILIRPRVQAILDWRSTCQPNCRRTSSFVPSPCHSSSYLRSVDSHRPQHTSHMCPPRHHHQHRRRVASHRHCRQNRLQSLGCQSYQVPDRSQNLYI